MKQALMAILAAAALSAGSIGVANAVDFKVGPGGLYVGPNDYLYHRGEGYGDCRTVITNEFGDTVTARRQTCY